MRRGICLVETTLQAALISPPSHGSMAQFQGDRTRNGWTTIAAILFQVNTAQNHAFVESLCVSVR